MYVLKIVSTGRAIDWSARQPEGFGLDNIRSAGWCRWAFEPPDPETMRALLGETRQGSTPEHPSS